MNTFKDFNGPAPQPFNFRIDLTEFNGQAEDEFGHGTRMAGCVAGKVGGTYKYAEIVPVKAVQDDGFLPAWNVINGMAQIMQRQQAIGNPGSVLTMSISFLASQLFDVMNEAGYEPLYPAMVRLAQHNIVVLMSAGNTPTEPIGYRYPRAYGGTQTPFIVVGSTDPNGHRSEFSCYIDEHSQGLLSLYALGEQIVVPAAGGSYQHKQGTSEATAMVAGMAARMIASGVAPANVKYELHLEGLELKGNSWDWDDGFPIARAGMKNQVTCANPVLGPLPTPTYTSYRGGDGLVFEATAHFAPPASTAACYYVASHTPAVLATTIVPAP